jgi:hypothetical protein
MLVLPRLRRGGRLVRLIKPDSLHVFRPVKASGANNQRYGALKPQFPFVYSLTLRVAGLLCVPSRSMTSSEIVMGTHLRPSSSVLDSAPETKRH